MNFLEELRCIAHSYQQIRPELVFSEQMSRFNHIFVNASSINDLLLNYVMFIILLVYWDIVVLLEVVFDLLSPM